MIDEKRPGQVLGFTLTPYVAAQPFRMWAVREIFQAIATDARLYPATASQLADAGAP